MDKTATSRRRISAPSHHKERKAPGTSMLAMPPPPADMSAAASTEWIRVGSRAVAIGVMPDFDLQVFRLYCSAVGDLADIRDAWRLEGGPATVMRPSGQREHPSIASIRALGADVLKYASALGLTPRSRKLLDVELAPVEPPTTGRAKADSDLATRFFND